MIGTVLLLISLVAFLQPDWVVEVVAWQSPQVTYFVETQQPVVALTIDDGPDEKSTSEILDLLKQYNAHATFFLIASRILGNERVVERAVAEKHELANHLMEDQASIMLTPAEFEQQFGQAHRLLSKFDRVTWFRPGSGWYDAHMLATVQKRRYQTALGSVYPFDAHIPSAWFAASYILWNVEPGSVIILHDYGSRGERTATVLAKILPELKRRGYQVVTMSELVDYALPVSATQ